MSELIRYIVVISKENDGLFQSKIVVCQQSGSHYVEIPGTAHKRLSAQSALTRLPPS